MSKHNNGFETPILLLIFNRPDRTKLVFDAIRKIKPLNLYVAADGHRPHKEGEEAICELTRKIVLDHIDWNCNVKTLLRDQNLGCGKAVSEAITWFFDEVEEGIILEDDCLPNKSFFDFCANMLERYKHNNEIMHISGDNFQNGIKRGNADYYFSNYAHIWGWATWRRAWAKYSFDYACYNKSALELKLLKIAVNNDFYDLWLALIDKAFSKHVDTWDFQWQYAVFINEGKCILPQRNLVSNIGFGADATHTKNEEEVFANMPTHELTVKSHPKNTNVNVKAELYTLYKMFAKYDEYKLTLKYKVNNYIKNLSLTKFVIRRLVPNTLKHMYKIKTNQQYIEEFEVQTKYKELKQIPRYTKGSITIFGKQYFFVDSASFIFIYEEIFRKQIYKFKCEHANPIIIDAGANIGLAILYFKKLFPNANITAFEPDENVFQVLQKNMDSFGFKDVNLIKKGLWTEETELSFNAEGADAGRILTSQQDTKVIKIQTVKLSDYLKNNKIDLLKIDIEGAEFEVLKEAEAYLKNVQNMFVEYHSFVGKEQYLAELLQILKGAGFRININTPGLVSQNPFMQINQYNGMDMQLNIYAIRA
jgi:FkbM family methyltransferase